jgi:hypothetical protein
MKTSVKIRVFKTCPVAHVHCDARHSVLFVFSFFICVHGELLNLAKIRCFPAPVQSPETRSSSTPSELERSWKLDKKFRAAVCESVGPDRGTCITSVGDARHLRSTRLGPKLLQVLGALRSNRNDGGTPWSRSKKPWITTSGRDLES